MCSAVTHLFSKLQCDFMGWIQKTLKVSVLNLSDIVKLFAQKNAGRCWELLKLRAFVAFNLLVDTDCGKLLRICASLSYIHSSYVNGFLPQITG